MEKIELYGVAKRLHSYTNWTNDRKNWVIRLITDEENKEILVIIDDEDEHYRLDDGEQRYVYVRGYMVNEGVMAAEYLDQSGRICSHCGKLHFEGYYVNENFYACSEECAIALCGSEQEFRDSIWVDEDGELAEDSPTYWTEWE